MPLIIGDDILREAKLTEAEARVEFACRLYAAERLSFDSAVHLSGLSSERLREELVSRGILDHADEQALDDHYARGYERFPEDPAESQALMPHLPLQSEPWE